ncbi:hypothetical protein PVAP13_5KG697400 [Panicum virgatum]|uniref:Uncharacterized protein n=1 Tax=Panicum virgatum TaxID=38727 RepID=A0A8T0SSJ9_PANVG|nr:hypothetical protein PVAP13_5KG697400 [Panicum virgatum]
MHSTASLAVDFMWAFPIIVRSRGHACMIEELMRTLAYASAADSSVCPATRQYSVTCHVMRLMEKIAGSTLVFWLDHSLLKMPLVASRSAKST